MTRKRSLAMATALVAGLSLGGCSSGSEPSDSKESKASSPTATGAAAYDWLVQREESLDDAAARIQQAFVSSDCGEIARVSWGGDDPSGLNVDAQCEVLRKRLGSGEAAQRVALGDAGGILQYEPDGRGRVTRIVLVVGEDGRYRPAFFDYVPGGEELAKSGRPAPFRENVAVAAEAMAKGDCDALAAVSHHSRPRGWVCKAAKASLGEALERRERTFKAVGATEDYALFVARGVNVYWMVVMARQSPKATSTAKAYGRGKAPEYVLANVVRLSSAS